MVILALAAMLILSAAISINAVWPVLGAVVLLGILFLLCLTACVLPGYVQVRAASSTARTAARVGPADPVAVPGSRLPASRPGWWRPRGPWVPGSLSLARQDDARGGTALGKPR